MAWIITGVLLIIATIKIYFQVRSIQNQNRKLGRDHSVSPFFYKV